VYLYRYEGIEGEPVGEVAFSRMETLCLIGKIVLYAAHPSFEIS
jgi:hypothetical protein